MAAAVIQGATSPNWSYFRFIVLLNNEPGWSRIWTANPAVIRQPDPPPELQSSLYYI